MTSKDRALRLDVHKLHLVALIANARLRNTWANDTLLKVGLEISKLTLSAVYCHYSHILW